MNHRSHLSFKGQTMQGLCLALACFAPLFCHAENLLGQETYAIGSSNFRVKAPDADIETYLIGKESPEGTHYIADLFERPEDTLSFEMEIPDDPSFYGSVAASKVKVATYLLFPTDESGDRPDYPFPYTNTGDALFPSMLATNTCQSFAAAISRKKDQWPLILYSHGYTAHGLWDLEHLKQLASQGYLVLSVFHGDGRIPEASRAQLRPLAIRQALDYLLSQPELASRIDTHRIGMGGSSFGGYTTLAIMGGEFHGNPSTVHDPRIKAGFCTVPWVGNEWDMPFGKDFATLAAVQKPLFCVVGSNDEIAAPATTLLALSKTAGTALIHEFEGEGHLLSGDAWKEIHPLEALFFDAFLNDHAPALESLMQTRQIPGGVTDRRIMERFVPTQPGPPNKATANLP
jgi:cephalosporin-C deacetylase-like acetyl esterase